MKSAAPELHPQVFRPPRLLAILMGSSGIVWGGALIYLLQLCGVPIQSTLTAGFFVVFFMVALAYYGRSAIWVDATGVTFRGMVRTRRVAFGDIRKVDVLPGLVTVYSVRWRRGLTHFTSFFSHHRRLMEILVQRAGLAPVGA